MASTDIITSESERSGSVHVDDSLGNPASATSHKSKNAQSQQMEGNTIAVEDVPSDIEMAAMGKESAGKTRWQRSWDKRWFTKGFRAIPCGLFLFSLITLCLFAIAIPTLLLGIGPPLAQDAVSATYIYIYNNRLSNWAYTSQNGSDCAPYNPSTMTITQDLYFTNIPWYATMGPLYIRPANLSLSYNGTEFGYLFIPQIDLNDVSGGNKWANDTVTNLVITNNTAFLIANKELIPIAGLGSGWTIWHQQGEVTLDEEVMGIQMYYSATMSQDVNVTDVTFLDGPLQPDVLTENIFEALSCTGAAFG